MSMKNYVLILTAACFLGCIDTNGARVRAAYDFNCSEDKIAMTELSRTQVGAEGCGHRGVYVYTQSGWVLNAADQTKP